MQNISKTKNNKAEADINRSNKEQKREKKKNNNTN